MFSCLYLEKSLVFKLELWWRPRNPPNHVHRLLHAEHVASAREYEAKPVLTILCSCDLLSTR